MADKMVSQATQEHFEGLSGGDRLPEPNPDVFEPRAWMEEEYRASDVQYSVNHDA